MAVTPPPTRPATPQAHPAQPTRPPPPPARPTHEAARAFPPPIGSRPADAKDPQSAKMEPPKSVPPKWDETPKAAKETEAWDETKPSLDPREETQEPHEGYPDGMPIAVEQRARSAAIEAAGVGAYPPDERPEGAETKAQVPGVAPPTKRE